MTAGYDREVSSILVVDDEPSIRQALKLTLGHAGFEVREAATGEEAVMLLRRARYDAVLLDMNMPGMGGMMTCREIRRFSPAVPILMLTIRDSEEDKVEALESGADDYVMKPFHVRELTARVRAAIRRSRTSEGPPDGVLTVRELSLDPVRRLVLKRGEAIHLTPKEFDLLHFLMLNAGKPIAHSQLLTAVWGAEYRGEMEYLRTFIRQLRKKLEDDPSRPTYLMTEMWFGYRLQAEC